jgi:hypothetical protein
MTLANQIAKTATSQIERLSTVELKSLWIETEKSNNAEIATVRGWIMDVFEQRDPNGFDAFLESNDLNDIAN